MPAWIDLADVTYTLHMKRVQIQLTESQLDAVKRQAETTGEGVASVVRRAVDAWLEEEGRSVLVERALSAVGGFHSGLGDLAERHDDYLFEDVDK